MDQPTPPEARRPRTVIALWAIPWIVASACGWSYVVLDGMLRLQPVNIRYAPPATAAGRAALEKSAGLLNGRLVEDRTWSYELANPSQANIASLLSNPLVEDSAHIDRQNARLQLDRPDFPLWLRSTVEGHWLLPLSWLWLGVAVAHTAYWRKHLSPIMGPLVRQWLARASLRRLEADDYHSSGTPTARAVLGAGAWKWYAALAALASGLVAYGLPRQLVDTNFYVLWETTALLAGDHPYRDFFQWGSPLLTALSLLAQWVSGGRLLAEFIVQGVFTVAGVLCGFCLAARLSRSTLAAVVTSIIAIFLVSGSLTFQFPKIFFYPFAVWVVWWYMEAPGVRRAGCVGIVTGLAFLFRHDHGIYIGCAAVLAFGLTRIAVPRRGVAQALREAGAYTACAAVLIVPWALVVQANEGFVDYVISRNAWAENWAPTQMPFVWLRDMSLASALKSASSQDAASRWLAGVTLLVPLLVLVTLALDAVELRRQRRRVPLETYQVLVAAALAVLLCVRLLREDGYFLALVPLTAALGARLLTEPVRPFRQMAVRVPAWLRVMGRLTRFAVKAAFLLSTVAATARGAGDAGLLTLPRWREVLPTARRLMAVPAIDGLVSSSEARSVTPQAWKVVDDNFKQRVLLRYLHDCTRPGDRLFVTGSTPYHVGYYAERPVAGGHVQWHHGWRSDPVRERQSLELIQRDPVPFAFSTQDPILDDLRAYPNIRKYMASHYQELEGTSGLLLFDSRRVPTGRFGALGFPCFA